jgi:hypothetical protein
MDLKTESRQKISNDGTAASPNRREPFNCVPTRNFLKKTHHFSKTTGFGPTEEQKPESLIYISENFIDDNLFRSQ